MKEKEIIRSIPYTGKVITIILVVLGLLLALYTITSNYANLCEYYEEHEHYRSCYQSKHYGEEEYLKCTYSKYDSAHEYAMEEGMETYIGAAVALVGAPLLFGLLLWLILKTFGMVITDKRIYGWSVFQLWRTDLPLDMVQSVSLIGFTGIHVRTAGGGILLFLIRNRKALHSALCDLLIQRNTPAQPAPVCVPQAAPAAAAPVNVEKEIYQLQDLRDNGRISQEEFDAKKKQLLEQE